MNGRELKSIIKNSGTKLDVIVEKSTIPERTIYNLYEKENIEEHYLQKLTKAGLKLPIVANVESRGIPLVSTEAFAGFGNANFSIEKKDIIGYYNIPEFKDADFYLPMKGESMLPNYRPGSILACKYVSEKKTIHWGKPYLLATKPHGLIIKRITRGKTAKHYILVSDNEKIFQPIDILISDIDDIALILGCATIYFE